MNHCCLQIMLTILILINKVSILSGNESNFSPVEKSLHIKEMQRSLLHKDYFSDEDQDQDSGNASIAYLRDPIDMVNLQNEAFSKMFVETPQINNPPYYNASKDESKIIFHKSTYPRSKIPQELKEKFDMISDNFNYNDEFWRPENIEKQNKGGNLNTSKRINTSVVKSGENSFRSPKGSIDPRSVTAVPQNKNKVSHESISNTMADVAYIKSDWIAKIIKIKEGLDKKCKCWNKIYWDIQRKPRLDTGFKESENQDSIMRKRSQTAIFNKFSQTQRFGFGGIGNIKALQTPQNMAQTTRMKDNKSKDLSIFQHFTISKAYDEEREKSYVPDPAPIDINQEEWSLIESDLKKYLESGQKLDDYNDQPFIINAAFDENKGPTYYIEGTQGNWEKIKGDLSENDKQRDPLLKSGQGTVYAQPKPNYKERSDIPERLIKIKIDR